MDAEITGEQSLASITPDDLIRRHGIDPNDWIIAKTVVNAYGSGDNISHQLKIWLIRRNAISSIVPARIPGPTFRRKPVIKKIREGSTLWVFPGDQQAPHQHPVMEELFVQFLKETNPENGVLMGDTLNFSDISRHKDDPEWDDRVQECVDTGYRMLLRYVQASPNTKWQKLPGNHDTRIYDHMLERTPKLIGLRQAIEEGEDEGAIVYSLTHLLRLDELGIEYAEHKGSYKYAKVHVAPGLMAQHGWLTGKDAGLNSIKNLDCSLIVGHTHAKKMETKMMYDSRGMSHELTVAQGGCMCLIEEGLGYAVRPDWANAFVTAQVWDDGRFSIDFAKYEDGVLTWRDKRWAA